MPKKGEIRYENFYFDEDNYAHYYILWNLNVSISYSYNIECIDNKYHSTDLKFDGDLSFSPYWRVVFNSYYNLIDQKFTYLNLKLERDLRSFSMNFNWGPISSIFKSRWNSAIGVKVPI